MFEMDDEAKLLIGFLGFFVACGMLAWHGCSESTRESISRETQRATVQLECLKAGHAALECDKLR